MFATRRARSRPVIYALAGLILVAALVPVAYATTLVRHEEISALVKESRRAILGEVVGVRYGYDERHLHSTWVTLRVDETIYGASPSAGNEITFKIYGAPVAMSDGTRLFIEGTPLYRSGQRYLLLLREDSPWRFTSATGLFQGAFAVDEKGEARSLGGNRRAFGESGLTRWLEADELDPAARARLSNPDAPVPVRLLRRAVERLWVDLGRALPDTGSSRTRP